MLQERRDGRVRILRGDNTILQMPRGRRGRGEGEQLEIMMEECEEKDAALLLSPSPHHNGGRVAEMMSWMLRSSGIDGDGSLRACDGSGFSSIGI